MRLPLTHSSRPAGPAPDASTGNGHKDQAGGPSVALPLVLIIAAAVFGVGGAAVGWFCLRSASALQSASKANLSESDPAGASETAGGAALER
jgi:hypothetical protein